MDKKKVFISWSGGKDSYLAMIKAEEAGLSIGGLVTFVREGEAYSMSHGLPLHYFQSQSLALNLPHVLEPVDWDNYEKGFQRVVAELKKEGFSGGVFGDINITGHRQWVEEACNKAGINPYLPLWGMAEEEVLGELLSRKAKLMITAIRSDLLDRKWLGSILGDDFIRELKAKNISPCGENGEYHTVVFDGPLFLEPVKVDYKGVRESGQVLFLDYNQY